MIDLGVDVDVFLPSICVLMNIPICLISVTGQQGKEIEPNSREAKAYVLLDLIYFMFFANHIFKAERLRECKQISLPKAPHIQQTLCYTDLASHKCAAN